MPTVMLDESCDVTRLLQILLIASRSFCRALVLMSEVPSLSSYLNLRLHSILIMTSSRMAFS